MTWNWQQPDWPNFSWNTARFVKAEALFLVESGEFSGTFKYLGAEDHNLVTVEAMSTEAITTSEIEGEILNRDSVQSSICRQLGLSTDRRKTSLAEHGIAEIMVDLHHNFAEPLSADTLFKWHRLLMSGRTDVDNPGHYRTHLEPMQVMSGTSYAPKIHFEAPPSTDVPGEMARFLDWFRRTAASGIEPLPSLTHAAVAHLYFVSIHPFEDGNGRVGRAIAEKALAQTIGRPTLTALASTILAKRKGYYDALEANNKRNEITDWIAWFAAAAIEAQRRAIASVDFLIDKTRLLDRINPVINERQRKALLRMLQEGPEGFKGGLTAGKYTSITGASPATATRDLADLVDKNALVRAGERRHAHYALAIPLHPVASVMIDAKGDIE